MATSQSSETIVNSIISQTKCVYSGYQCKIISINHSLCNLCTLHYPVSNIHITQNILYTWVICFYTTNDTKLLYCWMLRFRISLHGPITRSNRCLSSLTHLRSPLAVTVAARGRLSTRAISPDKH